MQYEETRLSSAREEGDSRQGVGGAGHAGTGRDGTGLRRDGAGWDGTGWGVVGWDGTERDGTGRDETGLEKEEYLFPPRSQNCKLILSQVDEPNNSRYRSCRDICPLCNPELLKILDKKSLLQHDCKLDNGHFR